MLTRVPKGRFFSTTPLKVYNDVVRSQFTVKAAGENAVIGYELNEHTKEIKLTHTEIPPIFLGKGVANLLAKHAFDHAQKNKLNVTCECHFLSKYYLKNRDQYQNIKVKIPPESRSDDDDP